MTTLKSIFGTWWLLAVGLSIGLVMAAADLVANGSTPRAIADVAIMVVYTLILTLWRSRSETIATLAGRPTDERWEAINLRALAAAGMIGALVALGGFIVAEASGHDSSGFGIVAAAVGASYVGAVVWYRSRL